MHMHAHVMISSCAPRARDGKKTPSTNQLTLAMLSVPGCVDGRPSCNDLKDKKKCKKVKKACDQCDRKHQKRCKKMCKRKGRKENCQRSCCGSPSLSKCK